MPFDGSGNYVPPGAPTFPAVAGNTIVAAQYNALINDVAAALSICITRDGQGKPSAAIDWNNKNLSNVSALAAISGTFTGALTAASIALSGNATVTGTITTGAATLASLALGAPLSAQYGGTGFNGAAAANGAIPIGNGAGFTLATLTAGANITITNTPGGIQIAAAGGGGGGTTTFPLTVNNGGAGTASPFTFDGSAAKTISYNSIGAKPIVPNVQNVASAATVTPTFSNDMVKITALAVSCQLLNWTGTAVEAWSVVVRIKDNGTARALTYDTKYRAGATALPTITVVNKTMYLAFTYNSTDDKFDFVGLSTGF